VKIISCIALAAICFVTRGAGQTASAPDSAGDQGIVFATNECFAKGGIGIVNKSLYIVVKSDKNELRPSAGKMWTGQNASTPEVVIFFEGRIWSRRNLPQGFDLSRALVVSFEGDKVRFLDLGKMSGGYYRRHPADPATTNDQRPQ
jgi:hypothetical protein